MKWTKNLYTWRLILISFDATNFSASISLPPPSFPPLSLVHFQQYMNIKKK